MSETEKKPKAVSYPLNVTGFGGITPQETESVMAQLLKGGHWFSVSEPDVSGFRQLLVKSSDATAKELVRNVIKAVGMENLRVASQEANRGSAGAQPASPVGGAANAVQGSSKPASPRKAKRQRSGSPRPGSKGDRKTPTKRRSK